MPPSTELVLFLCLNPFDEFFWNCKFSKIYNKNIKIKFANNDMYNITNKNLYICC